MLGYDSLDVGFAYWFAMGLGFLYNMGETLVYVVYPKLLYMFLLCFLLIFSLGCRHLFMSVGCYLRLDPGR
jgi:hypothetical protein